MKNLKKMYFVAMMLLSLMACKKDEGEVIPIEEAKIKQIKYSDKDKQSFTYNQKGQLLTYTSQWQFVQNDPNSIKTIVYAFEYDANDKLIKTRVENDDDMVVKYYYQNGILSKVEELDQHGRVAVTRNYQIQEKQIIKEVWEIKDWFSGEISYYKKEYLYDENDNLTLLKEYTKNDSESAFQLSTITEFSLFDNRINPDNGIQFPFLQNIIYWKNNPGKSVYKSANGTVINTQTYQYEYNTQGLILRKTIQTNTPQGNAILNSEYAYIN